MLKQFTRPTASVSLEHLSVYLNQMKQILDDMRFGLLPNSYYYTSEDLVAYAKSLIEGQQKQDGDLKAGNWSVFPEWEHYNGHDVFIDFVSKPTYYAVATLSLIRQKFWNVSSHLENLDETLKLGMDFIAQYDNFEGHGYDATYDEMDAMTILLHGDVHHLLRDNPELSPKLKTLMERVISHYQESLASGNTFGAWNENYAERFQQIVDLYGVPQDPIPQPPMMDSLERTAKNKAMIEEVMANNSQYSRLQATRMAFWTKFINEYTKLLLYTSKANPMAEDWFSLRVGITGISFGATVKSDHVVVDLLNKLPEPKNSMVYDHILSKKDDIYLDGGYELEFDPMPGTKRSRFSIRLESNGLDAIEEWDDTMYEISFAINELIYELLPLVKEALGLPADQPVE